MQIEEEIFAQPMMHKNKKKRVKCDLRNSYIYFKEGGVVRCLNTLVFARPSQSMVPRVILDLARADVLPSP